MSEMKRRGFLGAIAAAPTASTANTQPVIPPKRLIMLCDVAYITPEQVENPAVWEGMNIIGPIFFVPFLRDGPIRLLNIDGIPPEDIESLTVKLREAVDV